MISFRALGAVELTRPDGTELRAILAQPKRLALLTYLLLTPSPHFRRRDTLTALFWPELDQEHARSALRQAIHFLEQALGNDVLCRRGLEEIGFRSSAIWCDVREFEHACDRGAFSEALELYRGELIEALFIADAAPELESWLDAERDRLRRRAYEAAGLEADRYASRGDWAIAIVHARRAAALAPYDEKAIRRVLTILDDLGDRGEAVRTYEAFAQRLSKEYDVEPSAESQALIASVRSRGESGTSRRGAERLERLFSVEREISRTSLAAVYEARDLRHDRLVTLKVLSPSLTASLARERFQREIKVLARLQHSRIVPLYDSGEADGLLYYVMPFVHGESLRERLSKNSPFASRDAISIARQIASALSYLHAHDVVLRDLKPEGILLTPEGALLSDFGFARVVMHAGEEELTKAGVMLGTPAYMSPEQAGASGKIDSRSDIYALGCVLYEMLTGHAPFTGPSTLVVLAKHREAPVPSLRLEATVSESVVRAVQKALAKSPSERFGSADLFAEALGENEDDPAAGRG
jgi:DNA-binding SARP family transcriptional activator